MLTLGKSVITFPNKHRFSYSLQVFFTAVFTVFMMLFNCVILYKRLILFVIILFSDEVLKCGVCAYTCISTASMKSHLRIHTQDKRFSCKHCQYTCRQQGKLCRLQLTCENKYQATVLLTSLPAYMSRSTIIFCLL